MGKAVALLLLVVFLLAGCIYFGRIEVADGGDNAAVIAQHPMSPSLKVGYLTPNLEKITVGVTGTYSSRAVNRALYRFDLSPWERGAPMTFNVKCLNVSGTPGKVIFLAVNDFGPVPVRPYAHSADVTASWDLSGTGYYMGEAEPSAGDWVSVEVQEALLAMAKRSSGYLAVSIRLADETVRPGNYYHFSSYNYAEAYGDGMPYLLEE